MGCCALEIRAGGHMGCALKLGSAFNWSRTTGPTLFQNFQPYFIVIRTLLKTVTMVNFRVPLLVYIKIYKLSLFRLVQ